MTTNSPSTVARIWARALPFAVIALTLWSTATALTAPAEDRLVGIWVTPKQDRIEIFRKDGQYHGRPFVRPGDSQRLDTNNPDPSLRKRSLAEVLILQNFTYGNDQWSGGTIYDPRNSKTYQCVIRLEGAQTLQIRGYVGIPLFGRSEVWERTDDLALQPQRRP